MEWYIPLLIYCARITDVSIGTLRMILIINGHRYLAASLGFVEVIIWVLAVGGAIRYLDHPVALIAYGGGFATGTLLGMALEERIALGQNMLRVVNRCLDIDLSGKLRAKGYRVTRVDGHGQAGPVEIAFLVVPRRNVKAALDDISTIAPESFVTIERTARAALANTTGPGIVRPAAPRWKRFLHLRK